MIDGDLYILKFVAAFALVMGLMLGLAWVMKRAGLGGKSFLPGGKRRLAIVEQLPLDHRRRLMIIRRDDRDHLIIVGPDGHLVVEGNIPVIPTPLSVVPDTTEEQGRAHA